MLAVAQVAQVVPFVSDVDEVLLEALKMSSFLWYRKFLCVMRHGAR